MAGHARMKGFTLLELLVAITVLAMILSAALGAVRVGGRSWEAGVERAGETERLRTVTGFLRRELAQLLPLTWRDEDKTRVAFEGRSAGLRFVAPAPRQRGDAGLMVYRLERVEAADAYQLRLSLAPLDPGSEGLGSIGRGESRILADRLEDVAFAYYGYPEEKKPPRWYGNWPADAERFPVQVRIRMRSEQGKQAWPELQLPVRAGNLR